VITLSGGSISGASVSISNRLIGTRVNMFNLLFLSDFKKYPENEK
jgi:hypothetical protein